MKIVRRANVELTVEDDALDALMLQGFEEVDSKTGKILNSKKTEMDKLKEENKELKKENKALKAQLETAFTSEVQD